MVVGVVVHGGARANKKKGRGGWKGSLGEVESEQVRTMEREIERASNAAARTDGWMAGAAARMNAARADFF